jgi:hypothetical protein
MKTIKRNAIFMILILLVLGARGVSGQQAAAQKPQEQPRLKSIVVYEEKFDKLLSRKNKESETTYDINGNILEDIQYKDGKVDKHFKYVYDSNNNKIKETEYDPSGNVKEYSEYKYDRNLRTEKTVYEPQGKIKSKKAYIYTTY